MKFTSYRHAYEIKHGPSNTHSSIVVAVSMEEAIQVWRAFTGDKQGTPLDPGSIREMEAKNVLAGPTWTPS